MKKHLLLLLMACAFGLFTASAETVAFYATASYSGDATASTQLSGTLVGTPAPEFTAGDITLWFNKISSSSSNVNSNQVRWYQNDELHIVPAAGCTITSVVITAPSSYTNNKSAELTTTGATPTTFTNNVNNAGEITWEGSASQDFYITASKQVRFSAIEITYTKGEAPEPTAPKTVTIDPNGGDIFTNTSISLIGDADAYPTPNIEYSIDGGEYVTYTNPFTLSLGTHTVDAKATNEVGSATASASFDVKIAQTFYDILVTSNFTGIAYATPKSWTADNEPTATQDNSGAQYTVQATSNTGFQMRTKYSTGITVTTAPENKTAKSIKIEMGSTPGGGVSVYTSDSPISISGTYPPANCTLVKSGITTETTLNIDTKYFIIVPTNDSYTIVSKVIVEWTNDNNVEAPSVAAPVITGKDNVVTITAEDADAVYFTTDGSVPSTQSTLYTEPFAITATTVVKAIAVKDNEVSAVSTQTIDFVATYSGFAQFIAAQPTTDATVNGPITVVYNNGAYLYLMDNNGDFILSYRSDKAEGFTGFSNGDQLASITGTYTVYNDLIELIPSALGQKLDTTNPVQPKVITTTQIAETPISTYVVINDAMFDATTTNNKYLLIDDEGEATMYNSMTNTKFVDNVIEIPDPVNIYSITGFIGINNGNYQLNPIAFEAAPSAPKNPVFSVTDEIPVEYGTQVTVTSDGATSLMYSIDFYDDNLEDVMDEIEGDIWTFNIEYDCTVTVIASNDQGDSNGVEMTYEIVRPDAPVFNPAPGQVNKGTEVTVTSADGKPYVFSYVITGENTEITEETEAVTSFTFTVDEDIEIAVNAILANGYAGKSAEGQYTVVIPTAPKAPVFSINDTEAVYEGTPVTVTADGAQQIAVTTYTITGHTLQPVVTDGNEATITIDRMHRRFDIVATNEVGSTEPVEVFYNIAERQGIEAQHYFYRVENVADLAEGDNIIIVNEEAAKTMSNENKDNNRPAVDVTIADNRIDNIEDNFLIIKLEKNGDKWMFKTTNYLNNNKEITESAQGYFEASGVGNSGTSNNNYLKIGAGDKAWHTADISFDGANAEIVFDASGRNLMRYNTSSLFSCYNSGQKDIQIYKEVIVEGVDESSDKYVLTFHHNPTASNPTEENQQPARMSVEASHTATFDQNDPAEDGTLQYTVEAANLLGQFSIQVNGQLLGGHLDDAKTDFHDNDDAEGCDKEDEHTPYVVVENNQTYNLVSQEHESYAPLSTNPNEYHKEGLYYATAPFTVTLKPFESATVSLNSANDGVLTGVDSIAVDNSDDSSEQYYTLQGVRVNKANLVPGLYIRRSGRTATKVVIR